MSESNESTDSQADERGEGAGQPAGVSRRQVLKGVGAAGVAAAAAAAGVRPAAAASTPSTESRRGAQTFVPRGALTTQPNFLLIIVDEQRMAPPYESSTLAAWRAANLPAQALLRSRGMEFRNHHIMASACAPSRTSFLTGQYPSLHGVTQTSGIAKSSLEGDLFWLDPTTVPTIGDWFRAGGYDTYYKGKWHVSDADLYQPGTHKPFPSFTSSGVRDPAAEAIYLDADLLDDFGFTGWIGPEPHGSDPMNSASSAPGGGGRDQMFAAQSVELLTDLRTSTRPWLAVASFVNPHDIVLWGDLALLMGRVNPSTSLALASQLQGSNVPNELFDAAPWLATHEEDLSSKPDAQASYRSVYPNALQPTDSDLEYQRFYYQLQKTVDAQIASVLAALAGDDPTYRETIVVYLSDHGELLGAHGGLHQKWHVAYDEVLRVPFIVHNPNLFPAAATADIMTSHVDLLPTLLGLAGLDESTLAAQLSTTHSQVHPLPGRDLSGFLLGLESAASIGDQPQYFMTDDEPMRGAQQVGWNGRMYESVVQPCHLETVIAMLPTGPSGAMQRWKYTRYFDSPQFWSSPSTRDAVTIVDGNTQIPGQHKTAVTTVKTTPVADQLEIYNTSIDPLELHNIAADPVAMASPQISSIVAQLQALLAAQVAAKRLTPTGASQSTQASVGRTPGLFRFLDDPTVLEGLGGAGASGQGEQVPKFTG